MKYQQEFLNQTGQSHVCAKKLEIIAGKWPKDDIRCLHTDQYKYCDQITEGDRLTNHFRYYERPPIHKPHFILRTTRQIKREAAEEVVGDDGKLNGGLGSSYQTNFYPKMMKRSPHNKTAATAIDHVTAFISQLHTVP